MHVVLPRLELYADFIVMLESCARSTLSSFTYSIQRTFFYPRFSDLLSLLVGLRFCLFSCFKMVTFNFAFFPTKFGSKLCLNYDPTRVLVQK